MSLPSVPPQGDSDANSLAPVESEASPMQEAKTATDSTGDSPMEDEKTASSVPPAAHHADDTNSEEEDTSQENMAHEYVDYYVTNPTDLPAPASNAPTNGDTNGALHGGPYPNGPSAGEARKERSAAAASNADTNLPPAPPAPPEPPRPYDDPSFIPPPNASPVIQGANAVATASPTANSQADTAPPEAKAMTLMDHLGELRSRLVRSAIAVGLAFAATYSIADLLFKELMRPLLAALPPNSKLIFTALPEAFFVYLQVGFVAAIFLASPYIFYQVWGFIAPGLYDEEKKYAVPMALCSAFFFTLGAGFCFLVVFPFSFTFFVGFATEDIVAMPSLSEYLGFALKMLIAFGLIFEMPLFTFFLSRMGLVTASMMRKVRRYAILIIFIIAAILTPPDVVSQMLMAVPMLLLYELSIFIAVAFGRKSKAEREAQEEKDAEAAKKAKDSENTSSAPEAGTTTNTSAPSP